MKQCLLTGGSGRLGQELVALMPEVKAPPRQDLDLTQVETIQAALETYRPEVVIHAAAYTNVAGAEQDQAACWQTNVVGTRQLVQQIAARDLFLDESQVPTQTQNRLRAKSRAMAHRANLEFEPEILFHKGNSLGANAVVFAGGPIVVTDELVNIMEEDQLLAIIAHEFAHVKERHHLQQLVELMGLLALATIFFSSDETIVDALTVLAVNNMGLKKSREFEMEADFGALEILAANELDRRSLIGALEILALHSCDDKSAGLAQCVQDDGTSWFSTHPGWNERMEYLSDHVDSHN